MSIILNKIKRALSLSKGSFSIFNIFQLSQYLSTTPSIKQVIIQFIAAFKWPLYSCWENIVHTLKFKIKKKDFKEEHFTFKSYLYLLYFCLIRNHSPHYFFKFKLHEDYTQINSFLCDDMLPTLHDLLNNKYGFKDYKKVRKLLGDKYQFSKFSQERNIPTVEPGALIDCCDGALAMEGILCGKTLFCKPNQASQSQDAFLVKYDDQRDYPYAIHPIDGSSITAASEVKIFLSKVIRNNKMLLLQTFIQNHPEVQKLTKSNEAITARVITIKEGENLNPYVLYAQLEVPLKDKQEVEGQIHQYYDLYPLELNRLGSVVDKHMFSPYVKNKGRGFKELDISNELKTLLNDGLNACLQAHQVIDLYSVGFDLVFNSDGPLILEGNYNWSLDMVLEN